MEINNKDSKYRKDKVENQSKYIKSYEQRKEERKQKKEKSKEKGKIESAKTRYEAYLEKDAEKAAQQEAAEAAALETEAVGEAPIEEEITEERERSKGSSSALFSSKEHNQRMSEAHYNNIETEPNKRDYNKAQVRRIIISSLFLIPTILLQLARFRIPLTPRGVTIDLSAMFVMLGSIAFGPLTGVALVFAKNILYVILNQNALATAIGNTICDCVFAIMASTLYARGMFSQKAVAKRESQYMKNHVAKDGRRKRILFSGFISSITTGIIFVPVMNYIVYPIIFKEYSGYGLTYDYYFSMYQTALGGVQNYFPFVKNIIPEFRSLLEGIIFYNFPLCVFKLLVCTVVVAIIYPPVSRVLHSRKG